MTLQIVLFVSRCKNDYLLLGGLIDRINNIASIRITVEEISYQDWMIP